VRPEIQAIPAGISQILASSFPAREFPEFAQAGLEVGAFSVLSDTVGWRFDSYEKGENVCM
jgi:hypothetical protein